MGGRHNARTRRTGARERTAYHEAGHAVAAVFYESGLREVSIVPDPEHGSEGHVRWLPAWRKRVDEQEIRITHRRRDEVERTMVVIFAGGMAEKQFAGRHNYVAQGLVEDDRGFNQAVAGGDWAQANALASYLDFGSDRELSACLAWLRVRAEEFVMRDHVWAQIQAVAEALLTARDGRLSRRDVQGICSKIVTGLHTSGV